MIPLLLASLLLLFNPPGPPPQQPPPCRIAGIIVDASTNTPIPHAELSITNTDNTDDAQTFSASDGHFVFQNVPPGKYPLSAFAPGYVHEGFNQHGSLLTAIAVGTGTDSEHIIFRLHRQAILTGHVTDERGEPVRHAQVILFSSETPGSHPTSSFRFNTETNDLGEYRFAALGPGRYFVTVTAHPWYAQTRFIYAAEPPRQVMATGRHSPSAMALNIQQHGDPSFDVAYPITFYPNVTDPHVASEITLSPGDKFDANIQLQPVPTVHLHITNLSTEPMSLPQVSARQKLFGSSGYSVSAVSGQIAPGEMEVTGFAPGELSLQVGQTINGTWLSHSFDVHVTSNESLDAAGSTATANVSGHVLLPAGEAITVGGTVMLNSEEGQNASAPFYKDGTFSFGAVPVGTYRVNADLQEGGGRFNYFVGNISAAGAKNSDNEHFTISTIADVQLTVNLSHDLAQVTGVANLDGKPIAGVLILLVPASGKSLEFESRIDQSDSDGTFSLSNIRPGKYLALALDNAWDLDRTTWSALTPYLPKAQPVDLPPAAQKHLTLDVQPVSAQPVAPQPVPVPPMKSPQVSTPAAPTPPNPTTPTP